MRREIIIWCVISVSSAFAAIFHSNHGIPDYETCENRPIDFTIDGRNYFYSGHYADTAGFIYSWSEARKKCQKYCMDTVSFETQKEFEVVKEMFEDELIDYIWTSGHVCDTPKYLNDPKFQPPNNWYWELNGVQLPATDRIARGWTFNPWSRTGYNDVPQPDNAELEVNGKNESCLAMLHNVYGDGITLHDVACYHKKAFVCEDSDALLKLVGLK